MPIALLIWKSCRRRRVAGDASAGGAATATAMDEAAPPGEKPAKQSRKVFEVHPGSYAGAGCVVVVYAIICFTFECCFSRRPSSFIVAVVILWSTHKAFSGIVHVLVGKRVLSPAQTRAGEEPNTFHEQYLGGICSVVDS